MKIILYFCMGIFSLSILKCVIEEFLYIKKAFTKRFVFDA